MSEAVGTEGQTAINPTAVCPKDRVPTARYISHFKPEESIVQLHEEKIALYERMVNVI